MDTQAIETVVNSGTIESALSGGVDTTWLRLIYLVCSALFIFGLKGMTHPRTAVRGNLISGIGMFIAVVATVYFEHVLSWPWLVVALAIGSGIGAFLSVKVLMTQMPQMVALFNGFGGAGSMLVAGMSMALASTFSTQSAVAVAASGLIGAVTLIGSLVAAGKLQELDWVDKAAKAPIIGNKVVTGALFLLCLLAGAYVSANPSSWFMYTILCILSGILGVLLVMPIGGADMPVVISLLNSYSGLAACAAGFVINNTMLIIAGSLVGASGLILTNIMCVAMNRSLANVIFGTLGPTAETATADEVYAGKIKSTSPEEVAMLLDGVQNVVVVPGYGMAVAQAQHIVRELEKALEARGTNLEYAIHPVAGRMPGHMNVLLAESDVPYEKMREMDDINPSFPQTDVVIVVGANDVVNPVAREADSAIAGMPILDVDKARTVVVVKRSLSPGFAGIPNPLFAADNTLMLFGDGKQMLTELVDAVKES